MRASLFLLFICITRLSAAQPFNLADTLRGTINANRDWWDVQRYDISVTPDIDNKTISGKVSISYKKKKGVKAQALMQIDLQAPLWIDSVIARSPKGIVHLSYQKKPSVWLIEKAAAFSDIDIYYHGKPRAAVRPPWDGGWIWSRDSTGAPWVSVACQILGASVWYPCKDHQSDEPELGASLSITVPDSLKVVANGRLKNTTHANGKATYRWEVKNPINNYTIIPYIGKYVNFSQVYQGENGKLDLNFWVLPQNLAKAKEHFKQVPSMLQAFEHWFGPYPFYEDGFQMVDAPHLGMEHQSAIAYGNKYMNGYLGRDRSGSGEGLKWDYIIVHESGHEWFGNNITTKDAADMWVHEGFTCYSETLYTEYWYGKAAAEAYQIGSRRGIKNNTTIIGQYGVNKEGSGDMYIKGSAMIHTIRQVMNDDERFRKTLRGLNKTFYHKTVTTGEVERYISKQAGIDLSKVFDQYLRTITVPTLKWKYDSSRSMLSFKWEGAIRGFNMPVRVHLKDGDKLIRPVLDKWSSIPMKETPTDAMWNRNYYVRYEEVAAGQ